MARGKFEDEVEAIELLRGLFPDMPARTLARKIYHDEIPEHKRLTVDACLGDACFSRTPAQNVCIRPVYSIYSVIRRYDAKERKAQAARDARALTASAAFGAGIVA